MGPTSRAADPRPSPSERYASWVRGRQRLILGGAAMLFVLGALAASRLQLRTGMGALLPRGDHAAAALDEAERRMGELTSLVVVIRAPDPAESRALARQLASRLEALGPEVVERAVYRLPEVHAFFERSAWLYADEALLRDVLARVRFETEARANPLYVPLEAPPTFEALRARMGERRGAVAGVPGDFLESDDGRLVAIVVLPGSRYASGAGDERLEGLVRRAIAEVPPAPLDPAIEVSLAGQVHTAVLERRAVEKDVALTSAAVIVLVSLVVALYFGQLRAVPLMALPAIWGAVLALGFAGLAFGALNASTAFLGGIIVGNGINYPILLLARYEEELLRAREGEERSTVEAALAVALRSTARPTALAAFAASVAYGSLALTRFRGFSQFGVIGAAGMALCWIATMTLLPALLFRLDGDRVAAAAAVRRRVNFGEPFARATAKAPMQLVALGTTLAVVTAAVLPRWLADPYDYDFRHLRAVATDERASNRLDAIFGRALEPSLVLAASRAEAREAARVVTEQAARLHPDPVAHAVTVDDLLPGDPASQREKLALIDAIRRQLRPDRLALLSASARNESLRLLPPSGLRPLDAGDLPEILRRPFTEKDGRVGRVVLVYPPLRGFSTWNGHDLFRLAAAIRDVPLASGRVLHASGRPVIFASMIEAIDHDGLLATLASLGGVALLSLLLLGGSASAGWVLGALCTGVLFMLGVAALADVKLNFLNFIALPITFGIGVDYAANVFLRYRQEGAHSTPRVLRSTGGAVVLNSATTIIGYASLLCAHNRALRSFGALAILGETACLSAALLLLPSLLVVRDRWRERHLAAPAPAPAH